MACWSPAPCETCCTVSELGSHSLGQRGQLGQREEAVRSAAPMRHLDRQPRHLTLQSCMTNLLVQRMSAPLGCCRAGCTAVPAKHSQGVHTHLPPLPLPAGYEDVMLRSFVRQQNPAGYRLAPWLYTTSISLAFPSQDYPMEYFAAGEWAQALWLRVKSYPGLLPASGCCPCLTHSTPGLPPLASLAPLPTAASRTVEPATGLSYRDTDQSVAGPNFHPLIQQKRLVTGQRKGDTPQVVRLRRSYPALCWPASCAPVSVGLLCPPPPLRPAWRCPLQPFCVPAMLSWQGMHSAATMPSARRSSSTAACPSRPKRAASSMPPASTRASSL